MKKLCLFLSAMLAVLCFSCSDDEPSNKQPEILADKSTKEFLFVETKRNKRDIDGKKITLVIYNPNDDPVKIKAPKFIIPWLGMEIKPNEAFKEDTIRLESGENKLEYTLTGKAPDKQGDDDKIKVSFAGNNTDIKLKLCSLENSVSIMNLSGKKLNFLAGRDIKNKEITLIANNATSEELEIKAPEFVYPKEWKLNLEPNEAPKEGEITLKPGPNELKYTLTGKAPDKQGDDDKITVSFADKTSTMPLKVSSIVEIKTTYEGEELIVGKEIKKGNNKIKLTLTLADAEGVDELSKLEVPKSMDITAQSKGLSAKLQQDSSITLEKGKEKNITYALEGIPQDDKAKLEIAIAQIKKEIEVPVRFLRNDEVNIGIHDDNDVKMDLTWVESVNAEVKIFLERSDANEGDLKIKPSEFITVDHSNAWGVKAMIEDDKERIIKKGVSTELIYKLSGSLTKNGAFLRFSTVDNKNTNFYISIIGVNLNVTDDEGNNLFHQAAIEGRAKFIRFFINSGAKIDDKNFHNNNALHLAAENGKSTSIKALIEAFKAMGATKEDIRNFLKTQGTHGKSSLHQAAKYGHVEAIKALIEAFKETNADEKAVRDFIAIKDTNGETPLSEAAKSSRVGAIKALIEAFKETNADEKAVRDFIAIKDTNGYTSLHDATKLGNSASIKALIEAFKATNATQETIRDFIAIREIHKFTPLHIAAFKGDAEAIETLIEAFKATNATKKTIRDFISLQNDEKETALNLAKDKEHSKAVRILENYLDEV